ncbi:MAG: LysR family transcriptional regulator [Bradyrhizobium icense]|jgi:DNA-binding transcriptional LysR family regulator|nr:MAG: LysR family transcriptional regulator [Bradyrhizobium icense]
MNPINDPLDLNLLRVFFAIWDLRNLTAAGNRLNLTQPAISHALRRLRQRFNDPLFVRSTNRMLPTETAVRLHGPLDQAFAIINRALQEGAAFDPLVTQRRFRIAMSDIAEIYALPRLLGKLTRLAPMARIDVVPLQPDDGVAAMRSGEIDLSVGHMKDPDKECLTVDLFNDRFVCMIRAGHPLAQANLTRANFDKLRFFFARISTPTHQLVEQWLTEGASAARIAVRGHFTAAPDVIRNSDLAAVFPETMALRLPRAKDFRLFDLPFSLPPIEVKVHSHARFTGDLGIAWMRSTLAQALRKNR